MMKNADKLKEKAEMTLQAKGWLSKVVRVLYTIRQQKILMTWMSFFDCVSVDLFVVWHRFTKTSRLFQSTDGDYSSTRVFPGVPFDSESSKENQSKALVVISPIPECF